MITEPISPKTGKTSLPPEGLASRRGIWQSWQDRTPLGWLQLKRQKSRMVVAVAGIAFADLLMFAQLGIQAALFDSNTLLLSHLNADIVIRGSQYRDLSLTTTFPRRRLYQAQSVEGIAHADPIYIASVNWKNPQTRHKTQITVLGQSLERPALNLPEIAQQLDTITLLDTVLFDRLSRGTYQEVVQQVAQGESVNTEIDRRTIRVAGLFSLGASFATDGTIVASQDSFLRLFPERTSGQVSLGLLQIKPGHDPQQVVEALRVTLPKDVLINTKLDFLNLERAYWSQRTPIGLVFNFGTIMAFVVGIVIVFQILSTDVNDHLAEYATFKAMGYRDRYLLAIVFEEAIILAVIGFIPGLALALAQYRLIQVAAALPIGMTAARLFFVFGLTVLMCCFSGAIATRKLQSADPADIF
ncbi:MAG: ABC transporter permease DevC [Cyanobacteriota bacterium]|nr:ABC transporter permease DevC [Cyanobacteriota bacterium]